MHDTSDPYGIRQTLADNCPAEGTRDERERGLRSALIRQGFDPVTADVLAVGWLTVLARRESNNPRAVTVPTELTFDVVFDVVGGEPCKSDLPGVSFAPPWTGTLMDEDVTVTRPVRWFVFEDGREPVYCRESMREAWLSIIAEHCPAPFVPRWHGTCPWFPIGSSADTVGGAA